MHWVHSDIEELNQKVLLYAVDGDHSQLQEECLGAHPNVTRRLKHASPSGCRYAIRCGVPLVVLRPTVVHDLSTEKGMMSPRRCGREQLPELLVEINLAALRLAQRVTSKNAYLASLLFELSTAQLDVIAAACMRDVRMYATHCASIVRLRGAESPLLWERIMIGGCIGGPRGRLFSHDAALKSLHTEAGV